ncbi:AAA family ATPase [Methanothrix sp.]|uniref:ATP-binding protein n=1 Tax=Methanothrix sp. TaxID=90426 RepID=UPI003175C654
MNINSDSGGRRIKLAVSGKGGVGKTTLAGTLARLFARDGYRVLAIDADPDMNLGSALGIEKNPRPITEYKELIEERASMPMGMYRMNPKVDDVIERCGCTGPDGVRFAVMGTLETGGSGCMCPASAFLKALLRHVISRERDVVILDMEAGIEHLGRGTARGVDAMIVVVEPGLRSIETVERIKRLGENIGITNLLAVINKTDDPGIVKEKLEEMGIPVLGTIPFDRNLIEADLTGKAPVDVGGPAVEAIKRIKEELVRRFESAP